MKETKFIAQNKEKWSRFEKAYADSNNPEELSNLYMDITDDLSYAQTFYKRRTVRVYLNQLAQKVFTGVHKQKGESLKKIVTVWQISLPLEIYRARKSLTIALVAFLIYMGVGIITTHFNPDFPRIVMGDAYVNMTLENIRNGNPLAVYETESQTSMFLMITTNNLKVSFMIFAAGIFFTVGSHMLLFGNGVMLGAFQYFFQLKGLLLTTFLGIWIHGAFEISSIVIAGGAGITIGNGWLFPGTYTRMQSLQIAMRSGLKIMLSLVPFIIAAGFLESYVTHNYQSLSDWSKWFIIGFSFSLIIFVYIIYPIYIARKYPEKLKEIETPRYAPNEKIQLLRVRGIGEVLEDSFKLYRQIIGKIMYYVFLTCAPIIAFILWFQSGVHHANMVLQHEYDWRKQLSIIFGYGNDIDTSNSTDNFIMLLWSFLISWMFVITFFIIQKQSLQFKAKELFQFGYKKIIPVWAGSILLILIVFYLPWFWLLVFMFIVPFFFANPAVMGLDNAPFFSRLGKGFSFSTKNYGISTLVIMILLVLITIIAQPIAFVFSTHNWQGEPYVSDLLDVISGFVKRVASIYSDEPIVYANIARQIVYVLFAILVFPFLAITMATIYYSEKEEREALSLKEAFKKFGKRSRLQETNIDLD
ncbi:MAG: stage II sporulation protein M [Bacteroidota bacterium]